MNELAKRSGGRAHPYSNRPIEAMQESIDEGSNFYTISYAPTNTKFDGRQRRIRVQLAHNDYQLSYRHSYVGVDPAKLRPQEQAAPSLFVALRHAMPVSKNLIFLITAGKVGLAHPATPEQMSYLGNFDAAMLREALQNRKGFWRRSKKPVVTQPTMLQSYAIDFTVPADQMTLADGAEHLEFALFAYDADGINLTGGINVDKEKLDAAALAKVRQFGRRVRQSIDLPSSAAFLRVGVRDVASGRVGSFEIPLPLPSDRVAEEPPQSKK